MGALPLVLGPAVYADAEAKLRALTRDGYTPVEVAGSYRTGQRVNARSHVYPGARERGVGTVVAIAEFPESHWAQKWGVPDVELVILRWDGTVTQLGYHHVERCLSPSPSDRRTPVPVTTAPRRRIPWMCRLGLHSWCLNSFPRHDFCNDCPATRHAPSREEDL